MNWRCGRKSGSGGLRSVDAAGRDGVVAVESLLVLSALLLMFITFIDLSLAVYRHNALSYAVRDISRFVAMRGSEMAVSDGQVLGPDAEEGMISENALLEKVIARRGTLLDPARIQFRIEWPDGSNREGDSIRVELQYNLNPMLPSSRSILPAKLVSDGTGIIL